MVHVTTGLATIERHCSYKVVFWNETDSEFGTLAVKKAKIVNGTVSGFLFGPSKVCIACPSQIKPKH